MNSHADIQKALAECDADYRLQIAEAVRREDAVRATAFYEKTVMVAGFFCRPLTLADYRILTEVGNVFFTGREDGDMLAHCWQFLWYISVDFSLDARKRDKFMKEVSALPREKVMEDVRNYLETVWQDSPDYSNQGAGGKQPHWSYEASIIDSVAARYGWTIEYIMALPLVQIRAFLNIIYAEMSAKIGKEAAFMAPASVRLKSKWLAVRNAISAELRHAELNQTTTATERA